MDLDQGSKGNLPSPVVASPEFSTPEGMRREQFRAMGTTASLLLPEHQADQGRRLIEELFATWEGHLSRFKPESELSRVNTHAGLPIKVGPLFFTVLQTALEAARETAGLYDPTLQQQLLQIGYDRSFDGLDLRQPGSNSRVEPGGGWRQIKMDLVGGWVLLPVGVGLDFGGIAKGMAVDASVELLKHHGMGPALVNAGGDLAILGVPRGQDSWVLSVPGKDRYWNLPLQKGAMATSGIERRRWQQGDRQRHHLLDPRTGESVENELWSVTVVAGTCTQAEVTAKVAFILGTEDGSRFVKKHGSAALLVKQNGELQSVDPWPMHLMEAV